MRQKEIRWGAVIMEFRTGAATRRINEQAGTYGRTRVLMVHTRSRRRAGVQGGPNHGWAVHTKPDDGGAREDLVDAVWVIGPLRLSSLQSGP